MKALVNTYEPPRSTSLSLLSGKFYKRLLAGICLGVVFFSAYAQPQRPLAKLSLEDQAERRMMYEEYGPAANLFERLHERHPGNHDYLWKQTKCTFLAGDYAKSLPLFAKSFRLDPDIDPMLSLMYGQALHHTGNFRRALMQFRMFVSKQPGKKAGREVANHIHQCIAAIKLTDPFAEGMVEIDNAGKIINSRYDEHSPVMAPDQQALYFTARRPGNTGSPIGSTEYDEDIKLVVKANDGWKKSEEVEDWNNKWHDANSHFSLDGQSLYLYQHKHKGSVLIAQKDKGGMTWKKPQPLDGPVNSRFGETAICEMAPNVFIFSSDRPGGFGGRDLYQVRKQSNGVWSKPQNLGPEINTAYDEDAPFFDLKFGVLYFASNGPGSVGGYDLFAAALQAGAVFGTPVNMGPQVNTPGDDSYLMLDKSGLKGYLASSGRAGMGGMDIYTVSLPESPFAPAEDLPLVMSTLDEPAFDEDADEDVDGDADGDAVREMDLVENAESMEKVGEGPGTESGDHGSDGLVSNAGAQHPDGSGTSEQGTADAESFVQDRGLEVLQHLFFDFNKAELRAEGQSELDRVATILQLNPPYRLKIYGHTDWYGTNSYNLELSGRRIDAALAYLVWEKGIDPSRLDLFPYSENMPIADNKSALGRQLNRRVEFSIVDADNQVIVRSYTAKVSANTIRIDGSQPVSMPGFDSKVHPVELDGSEVSAQE